MLPYRWLARHVEGWDRPIDVYLAFPVASVAGIQGYQSSLADGYSRKDLRGSAAHINHVS